MRLPLCHGIANPKSVSLQFYMLNSRSNDGVLQWVRVDCQGIPPSSKDKLGVWVYRNK